MRKYAITEGERIKLRSTKRMFGCSVKHCPDEVDIVEVLAKAAKLTNHAKPEFGVQVTKGRCPASLHGVLSCSTNQAKPEFELG